MRKSLWMLALTLCCLLALCLNASAEADPALEPGGTEAELIEKAADPLVIELEQPTAMVVDKQFNLVYTISGGTSPYDVYVEVTQPESKCPSLVLACPVSLKTRRGWVSGRLFL